MIDILIPDTAILVIYCMKGENNVERAIDKNISEGRKQ